MPFLIYTKEQRDNKFLYIDAKEKYQLAGWGLIHSLWIKNNKPVNSGWTITADQLLNEHNIEFSDRTHSLVIDFDPNSKKRIGLIEIVKIHLFTYGDSGKVTWTPMMLELKEIFYKEGYDELGKEEKQKITDKFEMMEIKTRTFEFLYLNGDDNSWNWGKNGMTNAAFISDDARRYFSQFFSDGM